ncbi:MAG: hypothetical protein HY717_00990 [Planctomycetes bacterium]|nr:hypothetical protein [Planctomycetota bacterium]
MYSDRSAALFLLFSFLCIPALLGSCRSIPKYQASLLAPHKDAIALTIFLPERESLETYRRIVQLEMEKLRRSGRINPLPLYEARFEFRLQAPPHEKLAAIVVHFAGEPGKDLYSGAPQAPQLWETTIY